MTVNKKISALREQLRKHELDACIIPSTDPHMGEYVPEHWNERAWISGFTGSAGTVVITRDFAGLWTDSRYFLQAEEQLASSEMELVKLTIPHTPQHVEWIQTNLSKGSRVSVNGKMIPQSMAVYLRDQLATKDIELITLIDLVHPIWDDRPDLPKDPVFDLDVEFAGFTREHKLEQIRQKMNQSGASHYLVCTLDEIAWITNLRGHDVPFNPLFVSYMLISAADACLYIDRQKLTEDLMVEIEASGIRLQPYLQIFDDLASIASGSCVAYDPAKTNHALAHMIPGDVDSRHIMGYATYLKSVKNQVELKNLRETMLKDGIAWVKFLHWLDRHIGTEVITELSAAEKLDQYRAEQPGYQGRSFHPISSYGPHGAVVHYAVTPESSIELKPDGVYLCDTGGHYLGGTTDTTRTVALGAVTEQQKSDFTLALKGTLGVSMLRFPAGTKGYQMDILARKALWEHGLNYGHGTGHGVGFYLNVHEGPQTIGTGATGNMQTAIEPGMVTTVEPAIYRDGSHGMRTENMTVCTSDIETPFGTFLKFETVTLVPIDRNLIQNDLLTPEEIRWLNEYHQRVKRVISPYLSEEENEWLKKATDEL